MLNLDKDTLDSLVKFSNSDGDSCGNFNCEDCRAAQKFCAQQLRSAQCKAAVPTQIKSCLMLASVGSVYLAVACVSSAAPWLYTLLGVTLSMAGIAFGFGALLNLRASEADPEESHGES